MKSKAFTRKSTYLAALAALLIASFVAGTLATSNQPVDAQGVNPFGAAAPTGDITCAITGFGTGESLIVLFCAVLPAGTYLAFPTTTPADARIANRYLAVLLTARALGVNVRTLFDDDPTHNPPGCPAATCRRIVGLGFYP